MVATSPYLSSQSNPTFPPFYAGTGAQRDGSISVIRLDPVPIGVSITANPTNPTTQTSASFTFGTTDAVSSVLCSLDGAAGVLHQRHDADVQRTGPRIAYVHGGGDRCGRKRLRSGELYVDDPVGARQHGGAVDLGWGVAVPGDQLTASNGTWTGVPAPTFTYQWSDCDLNGANCTTISGATSAMYTVAPADEGSTIEVTVTGTNAAAFSSAPRRRPG